MYHGIINVYKEKGMTSFDVVAVLRRICGQKKIGHTGTLDPDAEGVLPVCLGKATRVCALLTDRDKEYIAVFRLGVVTDTQDLTGEVIGEKDPAGITEAAVRKTVTSFLGEQEQIPPMYSARKVGGKRLYELAREGKTVERKPSAICIQEIEILKMDLPEVTIRVVCSKGTYIRTLCHDIGERLGTGAAMKSLLRTRTGEFLLEDAVRLDALSVRKEEGSLAEVIRPVESVFADLPGMVCAAAFDTALRNGSKLPLEAFPGSGFPEAAIPETSFAESSFSEAASPGTAISEAECPRAASPGMGAGGRFRAYTSGGTFVGLYRFDAEEGIFRAVRIFYVEEETD